MTAAASGFTVDVRACTLVDRAATVSVELLARADGAIVATHGFAAPLIAALAAMLAAWILREAWRGLAAAPLAVVALFLAAMVATVVAVWPGAETCAGLGVGALLLTPLAIVAASGVVVGFWCRPGVSDVARVGLAAAVVSVGLCLLLARAGHGGGTLSHLAAALVAAGAGVLWLSGGRARRRRGGRSAEDQCGGVAGGSAASVASAVARTPEGAPDEPAEDGKSVDQG